MILSIDDVRDSENRLKILKKIPGVLEGVEVDLSKISSDKTVLMCFGGNGTTDNVEAGRAMGFAINNIGVSNEPGCVGTFDDVDVYSVVYPYKEIGNFKIGEMSTIEHGELAKALFLSRVTTKKGGRLDLNEAKKNIGKMTLFSYCQGSTEISKIATLATMMMEVVGYSKHEIFQIMDNVWHISYAPNYPKVFEEGKNLLKTISFVSYKDDLIGGYFNDMLGKIEDIQVILRDKTESINKLIEEIIEKNPELADLLRNFSSNEDQDVECDYRSLFVATPNAFNNPIVNLSNYFDQNNIGLVYKKSSELVKRVDVRIVDYFNKRKDWVLCGDVKGLASCAGMDVQFANDYEEGDLWAVYSDDPIQNIDEEVVQYFKENNIELVCRGRKNELFKDIAPVILSCFNHHDLAGFSRDFNWRLKKEKAFQEERAKGVLDENVVKILQSDGSTRRDIVSQMMSYAIAKSVACGISNSEKPTFEDVANSFNDIKKGMQTKKNGEIDHEYYKDYFEHDGDLEDSNIAGK